MPATGPSTRTTNLCGASTAGGWTPRRSAIRLLAVSGATGSRRRRAAPVPAAEHLEFHAARPVPGRLRDQPPQRLPDDAAACGATRSSPCSTAPTPTPAPASATTTTVPTQALFFLNDPFVHEQADRFAARLLQAATDDGGRIDLAHRIAYGRPATLEEDASRRDVPAEISQGASKDAACRLGRRGRATAACCSRRTNSFTSIEERIDARTPRSTSSSLYPWRPWRLGGSILRADV